MAISFETTEEDLALILKITDRFMALAADRGVRFDSFAVTMDITAAHANGCPMDLARWLAADDFNFNHDALGILQHLDRETGELKLFLPRHAAEETQDG